ncbi:hypothetical protein AWB77_03834 [Caballeronia fortuita]|uniref:Uncharacterized protein n=1 Tax=Caballeronia fortuita TaxID=1777138 RepID=A0A158C9T0_9BURK|nr:hypothetical protein [Caballeronia fortuita]SAK79042.1 hypothetical protein AWB77_03834 [Caballeronia fortuita]
MNYEIEDSSGSFALGGIAAAWQFRDGFPLAQSLRADFPVLTASLDHLDYVALEAALNAEAPVSLTSQTVQHASAQLHQFTLTTWGLHVHWLSDANASEIGSAMRTWTSAGESAFALLLPDSAPYNCLFGKVGFALPSNTGAFKPHKAKATETMSSELMTGMVAVGNRLKRATVWGKGASNQRHSVNLLLAGSIEEQLSHPGSIASALHPSQASFTRH